MAVSLKLLLYFEVISQGYIPCLGGIKKRWALESSQTEVEFHLCHLLVCDPVLVSKLLSNNCNDLIRFL